jgi:hypothetical protein
LRKSFRTRSPWSIPTRPFGYKLASASLTAWADLNKQAISAVLKTPGFETWAHELAKVAPTEKKKDRTFLEKHLAQSIKATIERGRQVNGPGLTTVPVFSSRAFFEFDQASLGLIACVLLPADLPELS